MQHSTSRVIALNCLAVGSGFYLTQILPVSPIYGFLIVGIALMLIPQKRKYMRRQVSAPALKVVSAIATLHFLLYLIWAGPANSAIGFYFNFLFLTLTWLLLPFATPPGIEKVMRRMIDLTIALGIAEATVRWLFPFQEYTDKFLSYVDDSGATFYLYKFNSIMYQDSNFVAMWLMTILVMALEYFGWRRSPARAGLLALLLGLTICRSAILFFLLYVALKLTVHIVKPRIARLVTFAVMGVGATMAMAHLAINDDSFQSKITIFSLVTSNYLLNATPMQLLFGLGLSNSAELLDGIAAHNYLVEVMMDTGLLGVSYTVYTLIYLARRGGRAGIAIVWLFILAGLSFAPITTPYLFVTLSLLAAQGLQGRSIRSSRRPRSQQDSNTVGLAPSAQSA